LNILKAVISLRLAAGLRVFKSFCTLNLIGLGGKELGNEVDRMYKWICPKCGDEIEETDLGQLEVRTQMHRRNKAMNKDAYLESLIDDKRLATLGGKGNGK